MLPAYVTLGRVNLEGALHHIGFVVGDIEPAIAGFKRSFAAEWNGRIWEDPHQGVRVAFLKVLGSPVLMELVAPLGDGSPVTQFLDRGGGQHHLCYEVVDLEAGLAELHARGNLLVRPPAPAVAFEGRRIAWVMTRERLLIELLEK
jgi:methylmalonyl-CoA/ethylmalonyl-CoA epimerase